ncbi:MAG: UDP-glucose 4-epimerase GalE [Candidatus Woykebacteria bacterium]
MKVVVTGGAGFIGSHIVKNLLDKGNEVRVIDNLSRGFEDLVDKRADFQNEDLKNQNEIEGAITGFDAVIHLGNYIVVPESVDEPVVYTENNVVNTVRLLEAMKSAKVQKIIFSSSATVYGEAKNLPLKEDEPLGFATNPYGASKVSMEQFIATYHNSWRFDTVILRYFNPYGPNELHEPETHAIPNFIQAVLKREPIPLYWNGEQIRDFIYVEDLAQAHVEVLNVSGLEVFNIGTELGTKVRDVIDIIFKIVGYEVEIKDLGERAGDAKATYASAKKIKEAVGWSAKTSLEEGLSRTIKFFKEHQNSN